jgi:hypothetical protein
MQVLLRLQAQGGIVSETAQEEERLYPTVLAIGANEHAG